MKEWLLKKESFVMINDIWFIFFLIYIIVALASFAPVLCAILKQVKLNPGGDSFNASLHFSENEKMILEQHYSRIYGTLTFWKNQSEKYRRFHIYTLLWTIPSSVLIPLITQFVTSENFSKEFLTLVSTFTAILLAFHRGLKIEDNYKSFRHGESEFYDTYRRLLDRPESFGDSTQEQISNYFQEVEQIRRFVRKAETDNLATADDKINKKSI